MFYAWRDFYATATASEVHTYRCERCGDAYCFEAVATATGSGHSPFFLDDEGAARRAKRAAKRNAEQTLRTLHFPVPCPSCGWYQQEMIRGMRSRMYRHARVVGVLALCSSVIAFCFGMALADSVFGTHTPAQRLLVGVALASLFVLVGSGLLIGQFVQRRRFDPNKLIPQSVRIARGREMAVSKTDLPYPLQKITETGEVIEPTPEDELR